MSTIFVMSYVVLWLVVVFLILLTIALGRQIGVLHARLPATGARIVNAGPDIGANIPQFYGADLKGREVVIGGANSQNTLLVFLSPRCPSCEQLAPVINSLSRNEKAHFQVILIGTGDEPHNKEFATRHGLTELAYVVSEQLPKAYKVGGTPYAVILDQAAIVRSKGIVNTQEQLESLLNAVEMSLPAVGNFTLEQFQTTRSTTMVSKA